MRHFFTITLAVLFGISSLWAGEKNLRQKFNRADKQKIAGEAWSNGVVFPKRPQGTIAKTNTPPGTLIFSSKYDVHTNGSIQNGLINYGDGTLGFARMGASAVSATNQFRGSYFSYFDGNAWTPAVQVESAIGRGWTSTDALSDGRQVILSHVGDECNVDALKGFGIWTSTLTGYIQGAADHIWARVAVDGADNIHFVSTVRARIGNARYATYYPVHSWSTDEGATFRHQWIFGDPFTELDTTGGQWQGFMVDAYAIDTWGPNKVAIAALSSSSIAAENIWLAVSENNGATWTPQKLENNPNLPPAGVEQYVPTTALDVIFDKNGNPHIFSTTTLALLDSAGTNADTFHSVEAPLRHWSQATGWNVVCTYQNIPGYDPNENPFDGGTAGAVNDAGGNNTLLQMPNAGVDADGNIYVIFNTVVPKDTLPDGANWMDVYAAGSGDGGASWGPPVNVTSNPGAQDLWGTLADLVDANLHIVYGTHNYLGDLTNAAGAALDHYYLAVPKTSIPLVGGRVDDRPGAGVPNSFVLQQNHPNPFNPSTAITFSLPASVNVTLEVYNMVGQKVATLVDGKLAAGDHTVNWNAQEVPSGVYFYKLEATNFSQTRKMVLMK